MSLVKRLVLGAAGGYLVYIFLVVVADFMHLTELAGRPWSWRIWSHVVVPPGLLASLFVEGAWNEFSPRILMFTLAWCVLLVGGALCGAWSSAAISPRRERVPRWVRLFLWIFLACLCLGSIQSWSAYEGRQRLRTLYSDAALPLDYVVSTLKPGLGRDEVRQIVKGYSTVKELKPGERFPGLTELYVFKVGMFPVRYGAVLVEYNQSGTVEFASVEY